MKKTSASASTAKPKVSELQLRAVDARKRAEAAKKQARDAKQRAREARRLFKEAKRVAKKARAELSAFSKKLKKLLASKLPGRKAQVASTVKVVAKKTPSGKTKPVAVTVVPVKSKVTKSKPRVVAKAKPKAPVKTKPRAIGKRRKLDVAKAPAAGEPSSERATTIEREDEAA
jgi:hypothetical protein